MRVVMTPISRHIAVLRRLSEVSSIVVALIGGLGLVGWFFDIAALRTWYPGLSSMKANAALCFVLLGGSLWLSQAKRVGRRFRIPAQVGALAVVLVALLTLLEYGLARDLGLDQLLVIEAPTAFSLSPPGRMTPVAAVILLLAGLSLLAVQGKDRRGTGLHQRLAFLASMCALLALLGYTYGAMTVLGHTVEFTGMSLPAVLAANLLSAGLLGLRPDCGFMTVFTSDTLGSTVARRLLPVAVVVPIATRLWTLASEHWGLFNPETAAAFDAITMAAVFAVVVVFTSRTMNDLDTERKRIEAALRKSEDRFRSLFDSSRDAVMTLEPPFWMFTSGNRAAIEMFRTRSEEHFTNLGPSDVSPERQPDGRASAEKAQEMIEKAVREGSCSFEWTHRRITGETFPAKVLLSRTEADGKSFLQATVRDITERKQADAEREQLIVDLKKALSEIRTLEGFIPICAGCKKIRDDRGFWEQVENYVTRHTEAKFSHGICPDREKRLYPEE